MKPKPLFLLLCCLTLALGASCQGRGVLCPKPISKRNRVQMQAPGGRNVERIKVARDKNGRVKKSIF